MRTMILIATLFTAAAHAELKLVHKTEPIYLSKDGKQVSAVEAIQRSIEGQTILKCQEVEAQASASGSVSFKNKK